MKLVLLITLFSFSSAIAWAQSCDGIRQDLLSLENEILSSSLDQCTDPSKAEICCRQGDPNSCKTKLQLEQQYNETLAKVVIAEGLASIGMAIESNHNALNNFNGKQMQQALDYFDEMNTNLTKADLIYDALEFHQNTSLFSDYQGTTQADVSLHIMGSNGKCSTEQFKELSFCQKIKKLNAQNNQQYNETMQTLAGFLNSDQQITNSDRERLPRYQSYRDRLTIDIGETNNLSPAQFKEHPHFKKLNLLINKLKSWKQQNQAGRNTASVKSEILALAQEVEDISVNYNLDNANGATQNPEVSQYIREHFDKVLTQLNLPDLILQGANRDNFIRTQLRLSNEIEKQEFLTQKDARSLLETLSNETLNGQTVGSLCQNNYNLECLAKLCGAENNERLENCQNFQNLNLDEKYQKLKALNQYKQTQSTLEQATACINSDKSLIAKKECLTKLRTDDFTELSKLRRELADAQKALAYINHGKKFKKLNFEKGLAINALNSMACRKQGDYINYPGARSNCGIQNAELSRNYEAIELATNGRRISLALNTNNLKLFAKNDVSEEDLKRYKEKLLNDCKEGNASSANVCRYYEDLESWAQAWEAEKLNRQNEVILDQSYVEDEYTFGDAFRASAPVLAASVMPLTMAWMDTDMVKTNTRYQLEAIENYDNWYMNGLNSYNNYMSNTDFSQYHYSANWGYSYADSGNISNFQYPASSQGNLFAQQNGISFDFAPIQSTTTGQFGAGTTVYQFDS
ncbi:MAG: hypothetical protein QF441_01280 [Bacteriovoracaceae bacterium]|jgi:hypothetical protein|nr:hypothetical protein [Halobacteriovoraceae bacterium]MDP7319203.1 hypothetical protein [Bacteriovoracaceae bacterium]